MKKGLFFLNSNVLLTLLIGTSLLLSQDAIAQKELVVIQKGGNRTIFTLASSPVITHSDEEMTVKSDIMQIVFPIDDLEYYTLSDTETAIRDISEGTGKIKYTDETVVLNGLNPDESVTVYMLNGTVLKTAIADSQGTVELNLTAMPKGYYVIKSKSHSFKIIKK